MAKHDSLANSLLDGVVERIESLPAWLRPVAYGPALLIMLMGARGAFIVGPVLVIVLLLRSDEPFHDLGVGAGLLVLLLSASAVGGLFYSVIGRWVRHVPLIGPWIAGMVSITPYMLSLVALLRVSERRPRFTHFESAELFSVVLCTVIFGGVVGYMMLRPDALD